MASEREGSRLRRAAYMGAVGMRGDLVPPSAIRRCPWRETFYADRDRRRGAAGVPFPIGGGGCTQDVRLSEFAIEQGLTTHACGQYHSCQRRVSTEEQTRGSFSMPFVEAAERGSHTTFYVDDRFFDCRRGRKGNSIWQRMVD